MSFSSLQLRKLRAKLNPNHVKNRDIEGQAHPYIEGWYAIGEANRIFGFDGWDREVVASTCITNRQAGVKIHVAYVVRVKVTVRAGERLIVREGTGTGEAIAGLSGQAHERAVKMAETDATKRALSTFGNAFGLQLYVAPLGSPSSPDGRSPRSASRGEPHEGNGSDAIGEVVARVRQIERGLDRPDINQDVSPRETGHVDKSVLAISEPKRLRSPQHLAQVGKLPCSVCGRTPAHAHHLTFMQPKALARKVSDEFTVPLCAIHHRDLHSAGNERRWWADQRIDPVPVARNLWLESQNRPSEAQPAELEPAMAQTSL